MGWFNGFSLKSLLILLTTQKSIRCFYHFQVNISPVSRTLLTCIKTLGSFPCPRCLISKDGIIALSTKLDMWKRESETALRADNHAHKHDIELVRRWVYIEGKPLTSKRFKDLLGMKSLVPTQVHAHSLLSWYLSIDFLSECVLCKAWEIWPWFLYNVCSGSATWVWIGCMESSLHTLDVDFVRHWWGCHPNAERTVCKLETYTNCSYLFSTRYRQVPTFGQDMIWKFNNNASSMKNLTGQDFEDLLQVCAVMLIHAGWFSSLL